MTSNSTIILGIAGSLLSALSGGGIVGWMQVRRQSKRDEIDSKIAEGANQFDFVKEWSEQFEKRENEWKGEMTRRETLAHEHLVAREREWFQRFESQNKSIMEMKHDIGVLTGRFMQVTEQNAAKDAEIAALKAENLLLIEQLARLRPPEES